MIRFIRKFFHRLLHLIWSLFLSGLLTLLPLVLTIAIFSFTFNLLKGWLQPIATLRPEILACIPHAELIIVIVFVFLVGTILKIFMLKSLVHVVEELISKIPIIRPVYSGIKQLVHAFTGHDKTSFKQVVLVEFPRKGMYSVGFLTSELPADIRPEEKNFFNVFIPTTPNPTSGFLVIVPHNEITPLEISRQEAMALIISGGIILPEKFGTK